MSSPSHPTSNIEDAFSLTFRIYTGFIGCVMHAYYAKESPIPPPTIVPPSSMLSLMFNPQEFFLPEELLPLKKRAMGNNKQDCFGSLQDCNLEQIIEDIQARHKKDNGKSSEAILNTRTSLKDIGLLD
ncbi:hypothetical protein Tco_0871490 [Tanacetum coccineum]